jgi:hypothetical protein
VPSSKVPIHCSTMLASSLLCPSSLPSPHSHLLTFVSQQHWQQVCLCMSMPVICWKLVPIHHSAAISKNSLSLDIPKISNSIQHVNYFRLPGFFITYPFHDWPTVIGWTEHNAQETLYIHPQILLPSRKLRFVIFTGPMFFFMSHTVHTPIP